MCIRDRLPRRLILTHSRMLDEAGSAVFLPRSRQVAEQCAERILDWYDRGMTLMEMLRCYEAAYRDEDLSLIHIYSIPRTPAGMQISFEKTGVCTGKSPGFPRRRQNPRRRRSGGINERRFAGQRPAVPAG